MATHSSILAWRIPVDRGAWWATVYKVKQSQTRKATLHAPTHSVTPLQRRPDPNALQISEAFGTTTPNPRALELILSPAQCIPSENLSRCNCAFHLEETQRSTIEFHGILA